MKFYKLDEVPVARDDQLFKVSPVGKAVAPRKDAPDEARDRARIIALINNGDEMAATNFARRTYGYNLNDATNFGEELAGGQEHDDGK